jgi:hypothetical protein
MIYAQASHCYVLKIAVYWEKNSLHTTHPILHIMFYILKIKSNCLSIYPSIKYLRIFLPTSQPNPIFQTLSYEPKISSVNLYFPHILRNLKFHHTFQQSPLFVLILSRLKPFHVNPRYFFQAHFIESVYAQVVTFFRHSYQCPWSYKRTHENVPHTLPISFFLLLFSRIFCIRQFSDSSFFNVGT